MHDSRSLYTAATLTVVWGVLAVVLVNDSVGDGVSISVVVAAVAATALMALRNAAGDDGSRTRDHTPSAPVVVQSSSLSIVSPVEIVHDGTNDRVLNCFESAGTERDWGLDALLDDEGDSAGQPDAVDLHEDWWTVADQGSTGSCVGWSCADSVLRWHFVKAEQLEPDELLSVRYVWMASKETDRFTSRPTSFLDRSGTSIKSALDIARKYGVVRERDLGFRERETSSLSASTFYARAAGFRIGSYINLIPAARRGKPDADDHRQRDSWRFWLHKHGPILTRLDIDDSFRDRNQDRLDRYQPAGKAGHAVAIVGYDADGVIIRNSWGTRWGDGGFKHASWDYAAKAFTDAYGVRL